MVFFVIVSQSVSLSARDSQSASSVSTNQFQNGSPSVSGSDSMPTSQLESAPGSVSVSGSPNTSLPEMSSLLSLSVSVFPSSIQSVSTSQGASRTDSLNLHVLTSTSASVSISVSGSKLSTSHLESALKNASQTLSQSLSPSLSHSATVSSSISSHSNSVLDSVSQSRSPGLPFQIYALTSATSVIESSSFISRSQQNISPSMNQSVSPSSSEY